MKARYLLSILATVAVLLVSLAYLSIGVLKLRVGSDMTTVTVSAPKSNGLHCGSAVLFRGVPIGEVTDIAYAGTGTVDVTVSYDSRYEIPTSSKLVIENQSMLGESGLFLTPDAGDTGPLITSGQNLSATVVDVPASVPELLGSTQTLLDQVDPTLVNDLVNTISEALVGTEGAVERLTPAAQLVAATLIYSQPDLVTIIRNATTMLQRGEWMGPSLRPVSPQMEYVGRSLRSGALDARRHPGRRHPGGESRKSLRRRDFDSLRGDRARAGMCPRRRRAVECQPVLPAGPGRIYDDPGVGVGNRGGGLADRRRGEPDGVLRVVGGCADRHHHAHRLAVGDAGMLRAHVRARCAPRAPASEGRLTERVARTGRDMCFNPLDIQNLIARVAHR